MNLDPYDITKWLNTLLEAEASGLRKLAASMLMQTLEGRNHLKQLWQEQPEMIKQAYRYLSDECLEKLRSGQSTVSPSYDKQEFYPLAQACLFCGTAPEQLIWVFGNKFFDCDPIYWKADNTWYVICSNCDLQLEAFSTEDTPPQIRIKKNIMNDYHQQNRLSWNEATKRHRSHKPDLIAQWKANPRELFPEDIALLGDVRGKTLAHLQCNDGQDTLSLVHHLGAIATGIDISDSAIEFARELASETGIPASFVRADVFEWFEQNENPVDVIYSSYGTINWIADIQQWANGIAKNLKAGGKFVIIDFHGMMGMFNLDWTLGYDYMGGKTYDTGGVGDYVGDDWEGAFKNPHTAYEFAWGVGDIVGALLKAGLTLRHFEEYPYVNGWQRFPDMREEGRRFYVPEGRPNIAMMFSIVATK